MKNLETRNKAIYIVGPSSTGKTTLCNALAKRLGLPKEAVITEVARDVMRIQGYTRKDVGSLEMQQAIMDAHLKEEKRVKCKSYPIYLCDRSAVDPIVYAILTSSNEAEVRARKEILINSPNFQLTLQDYRCSIFILLMPVNEWLVDDGIRLTENQSQCFEVFKEVLRELEIPFQTMGGAMRFLEERVTVVMGLVGV